MNQAAGLVAAFLLILASACAPVVKPAGFPVIDPVINADTIVADDGATLPLHAWLPGTDRPSAVLLGVHGFNDYGGFLEAAATYLAERGIASYAYDQRGFGRAAHRGLWPGTETLTRDLKAAVRALRRRYPGVPLYVLGESMGGAVAMVAMTQPDPPDVDGVILAAPAVWGRETMPWYQTAALWTAAHAVPWKTATGRGLGIKPSDNMEMLRALGRDPLVIKKTRFDSIYGLVNLMDAALDAALRVNGRSLILHGERDEVIPLESFQLLLSRLPEDGRSQRRVAIYADGYHMLLRDLRAETVWADVAAWIADGGAPLPSGADSTAAKGGACPNRSDCAIVRPRRTRSSAG